MITAQRVCDTYEQEREKIRLEERQLFEDQLQGLADRERLKYYADMIATSVKNVEAVLLKLNEQQEEKINSSSTGKDSLTPRTKAIYGDKTKQRLIGHLADVVSRVEAFAQPGNGHLTEIKNTKDFKRLEKWLNSLLKSDYVREKNLRESVSQVETEKQALAADRDKVKELAAASEKDLEATKQLLSATRKELDGAIKDIERHTGTMGAMESAHNDRLIEMRHELANKQRTLESKENEIMDVVQEALAGHTRVLDRHGQNSCTSFRVLENWLD